MRKITSIEQQKKNPNRVNIFLDGEFAFGLSRLTAAWLSTGQELTDEKVNSLQLDDARDAAMQKALNFLGYRARSRKEVVDNLEKHEIPPAVIETTISRLKELHLVNDDEFARAWVENRNTFRPRSSRVIAYELRLKGLDRDLINKVVSENTDDHVLAREAARKYLRKVQNLEWQEFRQKLGGFLGRRGFSYEICASVIREIWNEIKAEENLL
ncbi:MAG: RecX family transcriptional regulator [Chloroflexota bacterium]